ERVLEQHEMLVLGLQLVDDPLDLVGHADAELVKQRLGNPAFVGHDRHTSARRSAARTRRRVRRRRSSDQVSSDQVACPRKISLSSTRWALKAVASRGMQASGMAWPHMNTSSAA